MLPGDGDGGVRDRSALSPTETQRARNVVGVSDFRDNIGHLVRRVFNRDEDDAAVDSISKLMFRCPEAECTKTYQSQCGLDKHLESGKHKYKPETVSLRDAAIGAYKQELEGLRLGPTLPSTLTLSQL